VRETVTDALPRLALDPFPERQRIFAPDPAKSYLATRFADHKRYAPALIAHLLALAAEPQHRTQYGRHLGGTKLYDPGSWTDPAGAFLEARALALYRRATGREGGRIAQGWANVYTAGDYIVPHSHTGADMSVVYMLDPGEEDPAEPTSGRFCFADPRWALCCQVEPGRLSNTIAPPLQAGAMLIFPAEAVHFVHPYLGQRPRLTLSWNLLHG
jgi:hypothetical protein